MPRRFWLMALGWTVAVLILLGLALRASTGSVSPLDVSIAHRVQDLPSWSGKLFDFENWLGETLQLAAVTAIAGVVLALRRRVPEAGLLLLSFLPRMADVLVKQLVDEPRPSAGLVRVEYPHDNLSFPSGHVIGVTLVFGLLFLFAPTLVANQTLSRCLRVFCVLLILTIWLARVWVGAHWPSDTLGGYLYAAVFLIPMAAWYETRRRYLSSEAD